MVTIPDQADLPVQWLTLVGHVVIVLLLLGPNRFGAGGSRLDPGLGQYRRRRKQAANRKRRIIFNNDGTPIVYNLKGKQVTPEVLLDERTMELAGTHVDTIFYCTWSAGLGLCTHKSAVAEPLVATTGLFEANMTKSFHDSGLDPLQIMVDFCKAKDIEIFWSMRMNDIHDAEPKWSQMIPQFKKDHPLFLFGTREEPPEFGLWSGLDYDQPEVRQRAFELLADVCERYDVDGIEMDFARHFPHFRCNTRGDDCTQKERDVMTDLLRRVRHMTEQVGLKRNRPVLIAVRIPASVPCCKAIGLDVKRWLEQDLVDILVPGEWELSPWEEWVALGHRHEVPVYPCLSWTGSKKRKGPPGTQSGLPLRHYRSRAMNVWHSGADGVYTFNFFDPSSSVWSELGDPEVLAGLDKDYFPHGYWRLILARDIRDMLRFVKLPTTLCPERPVTLEAGQSYAVTMTIGEYPSGRSQRPRPKPGVTLSLQANGLASADTLAVSLNNHVVPNGSVTKGWVSFDVDGAWIRRGANTLIITCSDRSGKAIVLKDIHVRITYP